jgi:LacI family transcriptional regulator
VAAPPTIKDVAKRAGVGVATVSRVLNQSGYFDEDTARKVHEAVAALGYRRNVHWQRLSANSSRTICFLLGNRGSLNSMQMRMLVACERVCKQQGYDLVFSRLEYDTGARAQQITLPRLLADRGLVDGVILIGRHAPNFLEALDRGSMPWVLLGNNFEGDVAALAHNVLSYNDEAGCFDATSHLIRLGHRNLAFIGNTGVPWFARRYAGFVRALRQQKLKPYGVTADWRVGGIEYGRIAAAELLRRENRPSAVLAANDELAAGVWKEFMRRGVRIPGEISLCGFGDREEFQILEPALTTIAVYPEELGAELARMILARVEDPSVKVASASHPCQLVERSTCASPPARLKALHA